MVPSDKLVTDQYAASGLKFDRAAVGEINGVPAWLPVGSRFGPPDWLAGQLNFRPGYNAVISGSFVVPGTNRPGSVAVVTVDFVGGEPGTAAAVFYDSRGQWLGNPYGGPVEHPDGSVSLTFGPDGDIARFDLYHTFTTTTNWENPAPWGVSRIEFSTISAPEPVATPEPGAFALAVAGLFATGIGLRRRR